MGAGGIEAIGELAVLLEDLIEQQVAVDVDQRQGALGVAIGEADLAAERALLARLGGIEADVEVAVDVETGRAAERAGRAEVGDLALFEVVGLADPVLLAAEA